jgi:secondary thiamine-phosphate synthase enzyme
MTWFQKKITLRPQRRGFHLITSEVLGQCPEIQNVKVGQLHLFLQHTSASLTINENADPTVRKDFENFFNAKVQNEPYFLHTYEGEDDMPAHLKSSMLGVELTIPIGAGALKLGTWQGIVLGEHRDVGGAREIMVTIQGETF